MKNDLGSVIISAIVGVVAAFLICNLFVASLFPIKDKNYQIINGTISSSVAEPDESIFNFRAINPTVEVCVGECKEEENVYVYEEEIEEELPVVDDEQNTENDETVPDEESEQNTENEEEAEE